MPSPHSFPINQDRIRKNIKQLELHIRQALLRNSVELNPEPTI